MGLLEEIIGDKLPKKSYLDKEHVVVLLNNEYNSFEFIISILMKFVPNMSEEMAEAHAWRIDKLGKSTVYEGKLSKCKDIMVDINYEKEPDRQGGFKGAPRAIIEKADWL